MANHMRKQVLSMRGQPVDFGALALANADKRALGNANMNAKGDILGNSGVVIKTQEQIEQEWAAKSARQATITASMNLKADSLIPEEVSTVVSPIVPQIKPADLAPESFPTVQELIDSGAIPVPNKKPTSND